MWRTTSHNDRLNIKFKCSVRKTHRYDPEINPSYQQLAALNQAILLLLDDLNQRSFKKLPVSRRSQFEQLDQPALRDLPSQPYQYTEFKQARVHIDYHIEYDKHYYSVPHHLP